MLIPQLFASKYTFLISFATAHQDESLMLEFTLLRDSRRTKQIIQ
jgi:hypothetical protein